MLVVFIFLLIPSKPYQNMLKSRSTKICGIKVRQCQ